MRKYPLGAALLGPLALVVDAAEVGHNDRDGQRDDQHPTQRADGAKDLPHYGLWHHVAVPETHRTAGKVTQRT